MQGIWVFASAAARDAAVTSPQEGNFAYLKDTNVTTYYTGSAWANLDTTGMTNPMTTTGDTIYSSSGSTPARLAIGSTGNVLTVAGGVPTWAAPASGSTFVGCSLYSNSTQSINNGTVTSVAFNLEEFDTDGFHDNSTNNSRITIPSGKAGKYLFVGQAALNTAYTGTKQSRVLKNGNLVSIVSNNNAATATPTLINYIANASVGDYFEFAIYQDSGSAKNVTSGASETYFICTYLGA
jgi:hypothetical protein